MPATSSQDGPGESVLRGYTGRMLLVLTVGSVAVKVGKHVLSPLLPTIIAELSITAVEAGVALSAISVATALGQYPSGRLSDRLSRKTVLLASLLVTLAGVAVLANAGTYGLFLVGAVTIGAGRGLYPTAARALLSELFVGRRGRAFGVLMASSDVSGVAAAGLAVGVLAVAAWQAAFLPVLLVIGLVAALLHRWSREAIVLRPVDLGVRETAARIGRRPNLRRLLVAYSLYLFVIQGVLGFLPTFLQAAHGVSTATASAAFALLFVVGLGAKPLAGDLSDTFPRPFVGAASLLVGAVGMGLLVSTSALPVVFLGVFVFAVGYKAFGPVMQAHLMDSFSDASMGGDLGAIRTVYLLFGSLGPVYVGAVASRWSYLAAFASFGAFYLVAAGLVLSIHRSSRR